MAKNGQRRAQIGPECRDVDCRERCKQGPDLRYLRWTIRRGVDFLDLKNI